MTDKDAIQELLLEIRDNQLESLQQQKEQLAIAREQIERSRTQVQESIELQRLAIDRMKNISRIAVPGIILCFVLIIYLVVRYL